MKSTPVKFYNNLDIMQMQRKVGKMTEKFMAARNLLTKNNNFYINIYPL